MGTKAFLVQAAILFIVVVCKLFFANKQCSWRKFQWWHN